MMCARRLASQRKASLTNSLALFSLIAHPRKSFLKIARSQGCACMKCWASGHVAAPAARWLEHWKQETATTCPPSPTPSSVSKRKKKSFRGSLAPAPGCRAGSGCRPCQVPHCAAAAAELRTSARVKGVRSRQSDARQAIFTCFPRSSALPLLSSCTCQLCSRHQ